MENELKIFTWLRESEQWVSDAQTIIGEQKIRIDHLEENLRMKTVILEATRRSLDKAKEVLEDERHLHKKEEENLLNSLQLYGKKIIELSRELEAQNDRSEVSRQRKRRGIRLKIDERGNRFYRCKCDS